MFFMGKLGKLMLAVACVFGLNGCVPDQNYNYSSAEEAESEAYANRNRALFLGILGAGLQVSPHTTLEGKALGAILSTGGQMVHDTNVARTGRSRQTTNISIYSSGDVTIFRDANGRTGRIYNRDGRNVIEYD